MFPGYDLFDFDSQTPSKIFMIKKKSRVQDVLSLLSATFVSDRVVYENWCEKKRRDVIYV